MKEGSSPRDATARKVRHIIHADLDAFYASVEQLDNPELRGKPVLVGGRPENRGVVATASYEARLFGVHSAMPMRSAVRRCPQGIIVRPRFDRYRELSRKVMEVFLGVTALVEPLSLDEAYLDITEAVDFGKPPLAVALDLKQQVNLETGLILSVGVATNKSVAKIASDMDKPDGLVVVPPGEEADFLAGVGRGQAVGHRPKNRGATEPRRDRYHRAAGGPAAGLVRPTLRPASSERPGQSDGTGPGAGHYRARNQIGQRRKHLLDRPRRAGAPPR